VEDSNDVPDDHIELVFEIAEQLDSTVNEAFVGIDSIERTDAFN
jgi:hypothetical protein